MEPDILATHGEHKAMALEQVHMSDGSDDDFQYEAVSVASDSGEDDSADAGLEAALLAMKRDAEAENVGMPEDSGYDTYGPGSHLESKGADGEPGASAAAQSQSAWAAARPSTVDDFIRNFLIKSGMLRALDAFNTEWYEMQSRGLVAGATVDVPDVFATNRALEEEVKRVRGELAHAKDVATKAQATWHQFRKERDFHRMHHKRVVQEKSRLVTDLKRLKKHYDQYEPTISELKDKYESAMKEKMLIRLERDRLKSKVAALESQLKSALEATATKGKGDRKPGTGKRRLRGGDTPFPVEDMANPHLGASYPVPDMASYALAATFKGHSAAISNVAWHPSKPILATASDDATWRLWSIPEGELIMSGEGHGDWVAGLAFHPQGTHLATGAGDGVVKIWDFASAACAVSFGDHAGAVWSVDWHATGDFLASASMDHTVKVWDAHSHRCRQTLRGHMDSVNSLKYQPFSSNIATASGDKTVSVWDMRSGQCVQTFYGHTNAVQCVSWSHQGDVLVSGDADGVTKVWDVRMLGERATLEAATDAGITCTDIDRSGHILAVTTEDGAVKVFNIQDVAPLGALKAHTDAAQAVAFDWQSHFLVSGGSDATFRVWAPIGEAGAM